jgi:hypothetical protein
MIGVLLLTRYDQASRCLRIDGTYRGQQNQGCTDSSGAGYDDSSRFAGSDISGWVMDVMGGCHLWIHSFWIVSVGVLQCQELLVIFYWSPNYERSKAYSILVMTLVPPTE